nr:class I SAM-dependent DNA methyltransferase [Rodentibacter sp. JRC1]
MLTEPNRTEPNRTEPCLNSDLSQAFLKDLDNKLWAAANKLQGSVTASDYKHVVLGFIFLKYISDSFTLRQKTLHQQFNDPNHEFYFDPSFYLADEFEERFQAELNDRNYYIAENIFYVPEQARWENLKNVASFNSGAELPWGGKFKSVTSLIDDAFEAIEQENPKLKGVLQRVARFNASEKSLIGLINLFSNTNFSEPNFNGEPIHLASKDILGHVYEYFLGEFASVEGKKGGEYFTPKSIVTLMVEMLEPYTGRIYDPAMGSGGFFVQADRFIHSHQRNKYNVSIYGQEFNSTTYKLAVMNMAIRGLEFDFANDDTLQHPKHIDKKMDVIMANPPFNKKDWWDESIANDPRWQFGTPPKGNANFAWIQHMLYSLSEKGRMGLVLANGSMSSQTNNEGEIRKAIVQADLVEAMVALPSQLFTNVTIPACIWILNKAKKRKGEVLFIDARKIGYMKDKVLRDFTPEDIAQIADCYHQWQSNQGYQNQAAFCYSASLEEIAQNEFVLTPGRYVGTEEIEDDGIPFAEKMQNLTALLNEQFKQSAELEAKIKESLGGLGYGI